jgi:hypothetical protein
VSVGDDFGLVFHELHHGQLTATTRDAAGQRAVQNILDAIAARQHASNPWSRASDSAKGSIRRVGLETQQVRRLEHLLVVGDETA